MALTAGWIVGPVLSSFLATAASVRAVLAATGRGCAPSRRSCRWGFARTVSAWRRARDDDGGLMVGRALLAALVWTVIVEVSGELVQDRRGVAFVVDQDPVGAR